MSQSEPCLARSMATAHRTESFAIHGYSALPTHGSATVECFPIGLRLRRAGKGLVVAWGLAVVSIFIPVAHLFLVPGFVVGGIVVFVLRAREREVVRAVHGQCPDCGSDQDFEPGGRWILPRDFVCRSCWRTLRARPEGPVDDAR